MHCESSASVAHEAGRLCRRDALDKFGVVNVQMHRLSQELRPLLHYYAVHPKVKAGRDPGCLCTKEHLFLSDALLCTSATVSRNAARNVEVVSLSNQVQHPVKQWMHSPLLPEGPGTSEKAQAMCRHMQAVNAANAPILPIMLSTMALPEMEAEEKSLLADQAASMDAMSDADLHAFLAVR